MALTVDSGAVSGLPASGLHFRMAALLLTAADAAVDLHVTNIEGRTPCDHVSLF